MGLDVRAYRKAKLIDSVPSIEEWEDKYYFEADYGTVWVHDYSRESFSEWASGLEINGVYRPRDTYSFRAGAYSSYNRWREWLSTTMLGVRPEYVWSHAIHFGDRPFYRIVHFSDCEGFIGTKFCKVLAKDFSEYQWAVDKGDFESNNLPNRDIQAIRKNYAQFRKAFEFGADNGFVQFT